MRLASVMWPRTDIKSSMCKAITEQWAYDPMAISTFLFTMSLMEGKSYDEAKREVSTIIKRKKKIKNNFNVIKIQYNCTLRVHIYICTYIRVHKC